ncbi:uncharacterized protein LOC116175550 isoform X2 [Photinus pyralis]|uniref:uncharacterized protein LOC116175550 isoform X2 n=1 Tax=Photinus pyralis TaxID=7054 RepID=UPI0012672E56|nr:uncharacterized protein LOC116175550 isoform X2 [Photinus pyralis]
MGKISNTSKSMVNLNSSDLFIYSVIDKLISAKKNECGNEGITFLGLIQLSENRVGYITPLLCKNLFEKHDGINLRRCNSTLCLIREMCSKTFVCNDPIAETSGDNSAIKLEKTATIKDNDVETSIPSNKTKYALRGQLTSGVAPTDLRSSIYNGGGRSVPIYKKKEKITEENKEWKLFQKGTQWKAGPAKPGTHDTLSVIFSGGSSLESNGSLLTTKRQPTPPPTLIKSFIISRSLLNVNRNDVDENVVSRDNGEIHFPTYEKKNTTSSLWTNQTNDNFTRGAKFTTLPRHNLPGLGVSTSNASSYCDNWSNSGRSHDSMPATSNETDTFTPFEDYLKSSQTLTGNSCSSQSFNLDRENQKIYNKLENLVYELRQMFVYRQSRECCYPPLSYLCRRKRWCNSRSPQNAKPQKPTSSNKTVRIEEKDSVVYINVPANGLPSSFLVISSDDDTKSCSKCKERPSKQFDSLYKLIVEAPNVSEKSHKSKTCKNHSKCDVITAQSELSSQPPQKSHKKPSKIPLKKKCSFKCASPQSKKASPIQAIALPKNNNIGTSTCILPPFNTFCCFRHTNRPNCNCCNNCINYPRQVCGTCLRFTPKRTSALTSVPQQTLYMYNEKIKNTRSSPPNDLNENPPLISVNSTPIETFAQTFEKNKKDSCTKSTQTVETVNENGNFSNTQSNGKLAVRINETKSVLGSATPKVISWEDSVRESTTDEIEDVNFKDVPRKTLKEFISAIPKSDLEKDPKDENMKTDDGPSNGSIDYENDASMRDLRSSIDRSNGNQGSWENEGRESESTTYLNNDLVPASILNNNDKRGSMEKQTSASETQEAGIRYSNNEPSNLKNVPRETDFRSSFRKSNADRDSWDNREGEVKEADYSNDAGTSLKDDSMQALGDFSLSVAKRKLNQDSMDYSDRETINIDIEDASKQTLRDFRSSMRKSNAGRDSWDNQKSEAEKDDCANNPEMSLMDVSRPGLRDFTSSTAESNVNEELWENLARKSETTTGDHLKQEPTNISRDFQSSVSNNFNRGSLEKQTNTTQGGDSKTIDYSSAKPINLENISRQRLRNSRSSMRKSNVGRDAWHNRESETKKAEFSNSSETSLKHASKQGLTDFRSSIAKSNVNQGSWETQAQENVTTAVDEPIKVKDTSRQTLKDFRSSIRKSNVGQDSWDRKSEVNEADCSNNSKTVLKDASRQSLRDLRSSIAKSKNNRGSVKKQMSKIQENDSETIDYSNNEPINLEDASRQTMGNIRFSIRKSNAGQDSWHNRENEAKEADCSNKSETNLKDASRQYLRDIRSSIANSKINRGLVKRQMSVAQENDTETIDYSNNEPIHLEESLGNVRFSIRKSNVSPDSLHNRANEAKETDCSNKSETNSKDAARQSLRDLKSSKGNINRGSVKRQMSGVQENDSKTIDYFNNNPINLEDASRQTLVTIRSSIRESNVGRDSRDNGENEAKETDCSNYSETSLKDTSKQSLRSSVSKSNRGSVKRQMSGAQENGCETTNYSNNEPINLEEASKQTLRNIRFSIRKSNVGRDSLENKAPENVTTAVDEHISVKNASRQSLRNIRFSFRKSNDGRDSRDNRPSEAKEADCSSNSETNLKDVSRHSLRELRSSIAKSKINRGSVKKRMSEAQETDSETIDYPNNEPFNLEDASRETLKNIRFSIRNGNTDRDSWDNRESEANEADSSNKSETSLKSVSGQSLRDASRQTWRDFRSSIRKSNVGKNSLDNRESEATEVDSSNFSRKSLRDFKPSLSKSTISRDSMHGQMHGAQETTDYSNNEPSNLKDSPRQTLRIIRSSIRKSNVSRDSWENREREAKKADCSNGAETSLKDAPNQNLRDLRSSIAKNNVNQGAWENQAQEKLPTAMVEPTNVKDASRRTFKCLRRSTLKGDSWNEPIKIACPNNEKNNIETISRQSLRNIRSSMPKSKSIQDLSDKNPKDPNRSESKSINSSMSKQTLKSLIPKSSVTQHSQFKDTIAKGHVQESLPKVHRDLLTASERKTNNRSGKETIHLKEVSGHTSIPCPAKKLQNLSRQTEKHLAVAACSTTMPSPKISASLHSWRNGSRKIVGNGPSKSQSLVYVHTDRELKDWLPSNVDNFIKTWSKIDDVNDDVVADLTRKMDELEQAYDILLRVPEKRANSKQHSHRRSDGSKKPEYCGGCSTSCTSGHKRKHKSDQMSKQKEKIMKDVAKGVEVVLNSVKEFKKLMTRSRSKEM